MASYSIGLNSSYMKINISNLLKYFSILSVSFHDSSSIFGFFIFLTIISQLFSGIMLSFSLVPESMIIPMVRDEEDIEDLYVDDFFWLHERGVDLIFVFSYLHLFRKLFLNVFEYENESAWKSGMFTFLILQVVVFLGLVLCCTHLSEITLTIAANILHTVFAFKGKAYWWIFTDKQLNTDTIIRLAYAHYVVAFYSAYLGLIHGLDMHYDWKNETSFDGNYSEMTWWDEALSNELTTLIINLIIITFICYYFFHEPEALSYEIFMWGDIGMSTEIRFYGVAPHWYFRPFMAWLIACPHHITGIIGLLFYFFLLFYQPSLHGTTYQNNYGKRILFFIFSKFNRKLLYKSEYINLEINSYHNFTYWLYIGCCMYASSFLPYGRFFNRLGGNIGLLSSYVYMFVYLALPILRRPLILEFVMWFIYLRTNFLANILKFYK